MVALTSSAAAVTLSQFTFASDTSPTTEETFTSTTDVSGVGPFTTGGTGNFGRSSREGGNFFIRGTSSTFASDGGYITFTLSPDPTYEIDLDGFNFDYGVQQTSGGPAYSSVFRVRSSLDSFATDIQTSYAGATASATSTATAAVEGQESAPFNATASLTGALYENIISPIEFRIYITPSIDNFDTINRFDNVTATGTVSAVPEPSSAGLILLGAVGLAARRRR